MHAGGKEWIHKTRGIANENIAIAYDLIRYVGPIFDHRRAGDQCRLGQHARRVWRQWDLVAQELLRSMTANARLADSAVDHHADTHPARVERDMPKPTVFVGLDKNVARVGFGKPLCTGEIAVDREVLEEGIPAPQIELAADQGTLATGIDDPSRLGLTGGPACRAEADASRPIMLKVDIDDLIAFTNIDPLCAAVVQQQLIKVRTPDLVGMQWR